MSWRLLLGGVACGWLAKAASASASPTSTVVGSLGLPIARSESEESRVPPSLGIFDKSGEFILELHEQGKTPEQYDKEQQAFAAKPRNPVKAVIVGGGLAGCKTAALCDSLCDVTLIDEKNFFELTADLPPIIAKKWESGVTEGLVKQLLSLHRFYLKRSNVVTGTVSDVSASEVTLADGRKVEYDMLLLAHGQQKPFPWRTRQRTITGRIEELRLFNEMIHECKKIAIVGAGPMGVTLASHMAAENPDMSITLFNKHRLPVSHLTNELAFFTDEHLSKFPNLTCVHNSQVTSVVPQETKEIPVSSSRWFFGRGTTKVPRKYLLKTNKLSGQERQTKKSMIYRVLVGEMQREEGRREVIGAADYADFDYVFDCTGYTPKPIPAKFLQRHVDVDGKYRVSTQLMLVGHPNLFALGGCNSFPWTHTLFDSDNQARTFFKFMFGIAIQKGKTFSAVDGVKPTAFSAPHVCLPLAKEDYVANIHYGGLVVGMPAVNEYKQDRNYIMQEFKKPKFYKKYETNRFRDNFDIYMQRQITDVCDFEY